MADRGVAALQARLPDKVRVDAPLSEHTTLRVGGPAAALVRVDTAADLAAVAVVCAEEGMPWLVLGRGSNLLVADEGWDGVVVTLGRGFRGVQLPTSTRQDDIVEVVAGAAEPMPVLARTVASAGLAGLAFGIAIPGSLGGAVRMNAGAHDHDVAGVLKEAEVVRLGAQGAVERWTVADLEPTYRHTALPGDAVVVGAVLRLRPADAATLAADMDEMRRWRRVHQPINDPSCGSVFRNPPGDSAGRLIEASGLKGHRIGGAQVSPRHANFITADAGAAAADVHALIRHVQAVVAERQGVRLDTEVVLAGFGSQDPVARGVDTAGWGG